MKTGQAEAVLKKAALRVTAQRVDVLEALTGRSTAVSAQELHHELRSRGGSPGLATVYRALTALADAGALDTFTHDGEQRFRLCEAAHHHHLVCERCGDVEEVMSKAVESWIERIARTRGFTVTGHTVDVFGVCRDCR